MVISRGLEWLIWFSYAGAPWLTQKWVRKVKAAYCDVTPYGGYRMMRIRDRWGL